MAVVKGHEDLKMRKVYAFTPDGRALIASADGESVSEYDLFVGPSGNLHARPTPKEQPGDVDQEIREGPPLGRSLTERLRGVDQGEAILTRTGEA